MPDIPRARGRSNPVRTCVGCRRTGPRSALTRVVATAATPEGSDPRELVVDVTRSLPGRGAWLHPEPLCLELAERRRAFPRALRIAGPVDTTAVHRHLGA
ncbi:YlxR family protein [Cellulomonas sp. RIT-PI-Y]|uniref:YlxR family protein n=1 Tax=Cellulomonas sp. RIT-PI-Y TaxID=3035297 RepID=UPI0021D902DE|nr:YlxR family protein [Cellulomonas sp. RIT-PI-Y]